MKKWTPIVLALALFAGGVWFWSLGRLEADETPVIVLSEATGDVQLKRGGGGSFEATDKGAELTAGDMIKTGKDSGAVIDFYGESQSRLDQNTEFTITTAEPADGVSSDIRLKLTTGRVWSRVMRLLDLDGSFSVETPDAVATVRGTAFDVEKSESGTTIQVADSVVEAVGVGESMGEAFIPEYSGAQFRPGRRTTSTRPIAADSLLGKWFKQNQDADSRFVAKRLEKLQSSLQVNVMPKPGLMREIARLSEAMRERIGSTEWREEAAKKILERRVGLMRFEIERGNLAAASADLKEFELNLKRRLTDADPKTLVKMRQAVGMGLRFFDEVRPGQDGYDQKQQLENLLITLAKTPSEQAAVRLMSIRSRLDESAALIYKHGDAPAGRAAAKEALQSLEDEEREILQLDLGEQEKSRAERLVKAYRIRTLELLRAKPL